MSKFPTAYLIAAALCILAFTGAKEKSTVPKPAAPEETISGIVVSGNEKFREQIRKALALLAAKAYYDLEYVKSCVKRIELNPKSGMVTSKAMPTIQMSEKTAFSSLPWCASVLVHEACHAKQAEAARAGSASGKAGLQQKELECNSRQADALKKVGGSEREIRSLQMADGKHYDLDGDGDYDRKDYKKRNW